MYSSGAASSGDRSLKTTTVAAFITLTLIALGPNTCARRLPGRRFVHVASHAGVESIDDLDGLAPSPFTILYGPSEAELRIAQAQLVGWLEGLFHGIQAALFAQQHAARQQLEQMRQPAIGRPGAPGEGPPPETGPGVYL